MNHSVVVIGTFSVIFMVKVLPDLIFVCSSQEFFFPLFLQNSASCETLCHKQYFLTLVCLSRCCIRQVIQKLTLYPISPLALKNKNALCLMSYMRKIPVLRNSGAVSQVSCLLQPHFPSELRRGDLKADMVVHALQVQYSESKAEGASCWDSKTRKETIEDLTARQ